MKMIVQWATGKFQKRTSVAIGLIIFYLLALFLSIIVYIGVYSVDFSVGKSEPAILRIAISGGTVLLMTPVTLPMSFYDTVGILDWRNALNTNMGAVSILIYWVATIILITVAVVTRRRYWLIIYAMLLLVSSLKWVAFSLMSLGI